MNLIAAVIACYDDAGCTVAQIIFRRDGTIQMFGDTDTAKRTLALIRANG